MTEMILKAVPHGRLKKIEFKVKRNCANTHWSRFIELFLSSVSCKLQYFFSTFGVVRTDLF